MGNFKEDIARTEAYIFDVDGVMTDGGIIPTLDGDFIRRYNAKDGYALGYAVKMGYKVCIITGGRGKTLENRLRMLGINRYYTDCMDKITAMREYFADEGIDPSAGSVGDSYDNSLAESQIGLYKSELIHHEGPWRDVDQVEVATASWVQWFNTERTHSSIDDLTPVEAEQHDYAHTEPLERTG